MTEKPTTKNDAPSRTECDICGVVLTWGDAYLAGGPPPVPDLVLCESCWGIDIDIEAAKETKQ